MVLRKDCWYFDVCLCDTCTNCIRYAEMKYLMDNSGLPVKRQKPVILNAGVDRDAFCELADIKDDIVRFVEDGECLYIYSEFTGNGKTSWAIKLLLRYFDQIWPGNGFNIRGYFAHVPTLLAQLKDFEDTSGRRNHLRKCLTNCDVVVWDDIASTRLSDYDTSQLLMLIDLRIAQGLSNIYTGNITSRDALARSLGERLASRVWNVSRRVEFRGKDRRHD